MIHDANGISPHFVTSVSLSPGMQVPHLSAIAIYALGMNAVGQVLLSGDRLLSLLTQCITYLADDATSSEGIGVAALSASKALAVATVSFSLAGVSSIWRSPYYKLTVPGIRLAISAFCYWVIASALLVLMSKHDNVTDNVKSLLLSSAGLCGGISLAAVGARAFGVAKQHMKRSADEVLESSARSKILYLRPFKADKLGEPEELALDKRELGFTMWQILSLGFWTDRRKWSFEEVLCDGLSAAGPVVAIGEPGEQLPRLGAARKYVVHEQWRVEVAKMVAQSRLVCVVAGNSEGLVWELKHIVSSAMPNQVLLIIPHSDRDYEWSWQKLVRLATARNVGVRLPDSLMPDTIALAFDSAWNPIEVTGCQTTAYYRELAILAAKHTLVSA